MLTKRSPRCDSELRSESQKLLIPPPPPPLRSSGENAPPRVPADLAAAEMKRSLRLPFSLLVLVVILTLLSFRAAVRWSGSPDYTPLPAAPLNETLLRLAAADPVAAALRKDVDDLLDGNLPAAATTARRYRSIPLWRRENYHEPRHHLELRSRYPTRYQIRFRAPRDYRFFPEFRRALRDWFRSRRFHPGVMSELLLQIKGNSDEDRRYSSCAVVGNSGILLQHDHGALIDGHEMVIRLNNARIEGYHRNVGSKTTLSFVNSNILHLCARREGCFCHPYGENVPILMYICQPIHFLDYIACNSSHKAPLLVTDPRLDILSARIVKYYSLKRFVEETGKAPDEWSKAHDERAFHYSSGMQAIVVAVGICDRVSVFGFGKSTEAKHHYHTNQKAELSLHDYGAEYEFYRDLVERPQVIPFLGDSGFKTPSIVFYH